MRLLDKPKTLLSKDVLVSSAQAGSQRTAGMLVPAEALQLSLLQLVATAVCSVSSLAGQAKLARMV